MELRVRRIRIHKITTASLVGIFGVLLFLLIAIFMASDRLNNDTKTLAQIPEDAISSEDEDKEVFLDKEAVTELKIAENYAHSAGVIYLTFDDGPSEHTGRLLDTLKKYNAKATFFVTGRGDDALIKREHDEGHTVGLHTWSHVYSEVYSSVDNYFADLYKIRDRVKNITGEDPKLIRFPGGSSNLVSAQYTKGIMSTLAREVENRGFRYFDWNVVSGDAGGTYTSDGVYNNVTSRLHEGANVVLQHDIKDFSVDAVERIIQYGTANGFTFEALKFDSPGMHHGINN